MLVYLFNFNNPKTPDIPVVKKEHKNLFIRILVLI